MNIGDNNRFIVTIPGSSAASVKSLLGTVLVIYIEKGSLKYWRSRKVNVQVSKPLKNSEFRDGKGCYQTVCAWSGATLSHLAEALFGEGC